MTVGDLFKRFNNEKDKDKVILFVDKNGGWSNINVEAVTDTVILITESPILFDD